MSPTIMVVEDDDNIRELLAQLLQDEGYNVETAMHGRAALDAVIAAHVAPCLVITDLMMPVMSGWEFCRERLKIPQLADVPVIVISAIHALPNQVATLGIVAAFPKPLDLDALVALIMHHCPLM